MYHSLDFTKIKPSEAYQWMIGAIVPRPIAWVSTQNLVGIVNLAPFSFFSGVCSNPPCLSIAITRQTDGSKKDTLLNIEKMGEFVVNSSQRSFAQEINQTSMQLPYGESELDHVKLSTLPSQIVRPPRIAECLIQQECVLEKIVEVGTGGRGSSTLVIGRIVICHVSQSIITDGKIDYRKLDPIARLGGKEWLEKGNVFEQERP